MKVPLVLLIFGLAAQLFAQPSADEEGRIGFCAIDIYLDPRGAPLAAYQIQFADTNGAAKVVGIEGGESAGFRQPPFYDPKAMQQDRVIIAAFTTNSVGELPLTKTRVATIHLQTRGTIAPGFELKLQAAGDPAGSRIQADASFEERKTQ